MFCVSFFRLRVRLSVGVVFVFCRLYQRVFVSEDESRKERERIEENYQGKGQKRWRRQDAWCLQEKKREQYAPCFLCFTCST